MSQRRKKIRNVEFLSLLPEKDVFYTREVKEGEREIEKRDTVVNT